MESQRLGQKDSCVSCGRVLTADERGMSGKLVNRATDVFWCMECLSHKTGISVPVLQQKAACFRKMGCTLFK